MTISGDHYISGNMTQAAAEPPRLPPGASPAQAQAYRDWMVGQGYDPARLEGMTPRELANMYTYGPDVWDADEAYVQTLLVANGCDPGPIDGWCGPQTSDAIAQFQRSNGLEVTGEIDEPTLAALQEGASANAEAATASPDSADTTDAATTTDSAVDNLIDRQATMETVEPEIGEGEDETAVDRASRNLHDAELLLDSALQAEIDLLADAGMSREQAIAQIRTRHEDSEAELAAIDASLARLDPDYAPSSTGADRPDSGEPNSIGSSDSASAFARPPGVGFFAEAEAAEVEQAGEDAETAPNPLP